MIRSDELVVDCFAGGGGASTGIEAALGRPIDIAINHDPQAIAMHVANHRKTRHYCENVWDVDPREATSGRPVGLAWFSPDCTFHSKARGGKPFRDRRRARRIRGLAWLVIRWAKAVRPRVIMLENVEEFANWGPLLDDGKPCPIRRGMTFRRWHRQLENLGYRIDMRELRCCDYGTPTIRKRLFIVARCDDAEIVIPEPTHGPGLIPYRTAAECIDWDIPCPSIFERKKPLVEATMRRIANGIRRYVIENPEPFIVGIDNANGAQLCAAFLAKHFGGNETPGWPLDEPISTVTAKDHHALVTSHLLKLKGIDYQIVDIGMRMLRPRELFLAQGFPPAYTIDPIYNGKPLTITAQVRMCGNSVPPQPAEALVRANLVNERRRDYRVTC